MTRAVSVFKLKESVNSDKANADLLLYVNAMLQKYLKVYFEKPDDFCVPDGVQSDKILLTNLYNFTQPYIRYEITDRIIMHHELCACGNPSPWLTLEGRTDDVLHFFEIGREIKIAPLAIYATLKEIPEIRRFQLLTHHQNRLEMRLVPANGCDKTFVFEKASGVLKDFLESHGVKNVSIFLSDEKPQQHPQSGKFKHIMNMAKR